MAVILFPHPLSPTMPMIFPAGTSMLTPSTAGTSPFAVKKWDFRSRISNTIESFMFFSFSFLPLSGKNAPSLLATAPARQAQPVTTAVFFHAVPALLLLQIRVQHIAQTIAQEVKCHHHDHDRNTRRNGKPRLGKQIFLSAHNHQPPAGTRRLCTDTQEA